MRSLLIGPDPGAIELCVDGSYIVQQAPDRPSYDVTVRTRKRAPAGTATRILSASQRTILTLPFTVLFCRGNSLTNANADVDALQAVLTAAEEYWTLRTGVPSYVRSQMNDETVPKIWTIERAEFDDSEHGFPEAWGWRVMSLNISVYKGQVA